MFSQTTEYALRATVFLAQQADKTQTRYQISQATKVPVDYLAKVMRSLVSAGLVSASRGLHGGFMLAREVDEISILDVVNAVEPLKRLKGCPLGIASHGKRLCPLHRELDDAVATIERAFASTQLSELVDRRQRIRPLCEVPLRVLEAHS